MTGEAAPQRDLTKADYEQLAEFRYLLRRFLLFSEDAAEQTGLTAQQHQALLAIRGAPGRSCLTMGELAERMGIRHHSAVGLIDRLASKRLVVRRVGTEDRRKVHISLAPRAEALLRELSVAHRGELARLAPLLQALLQQLGRTQARYGAVREAAGGPTGKRRMRQRGAERVKGTEPSS